MEIVDYVAEIGGTYARLMLLLDLARPYASELGESEMRTELDLMVTACGRRLEELLKEEAARTVAPTE